MRMRRAGAMAMPMDMAREHRAIAAQRRVEGIGVCLVLIRTRVVAPVFVMDMPVLDERRSKGMGMAAVMMAGFDAPRLGLVRMAPAVRVVVAGEKREVVAMSVAAVAVGMTMRAAAHLAQSRNRYPSAERDQRDARSGLDEMAEARRDRDPGEPDDRGNQQRRKYMAGSGQKSRARGLALRPAALPRDQRDRRPVIGDNGVQDADDANGADQQKSGIGWKIHRGVSQISGGRLAFGQRRARGAAIAADRRFKAIMPTIERKCPSARLSRLIISGGLCVPFAHPIPGTGQDNIQRRRGPAPAPSLSSRDFRGMDLRGRAGLPATGQSTKSDECPL
jgi:hypothetical protein